MSSVRRLVGSAGSLWRELAPGLAAYVRRVNQGGYERIYLPWRGNTDRSRHFLLNETSFQMVRLSKSGLETDLDIDVVFDSVRHGWNARLSPSVVDQSSLSAEEKAEVKELSARTENMLRRQMGQNLSLSARFAASGRLEEIEVDVIGPSCLGEIKSGERSFRSLDFRQVLVDIVCTPDCDDRWSVHLMNPREGVVWQSTVSDFVESVSLAPVVEFRQNLLFYLVDVGISA